MNTAESRRPENPAAAQAKGGAATRPDPDGPAATLASSVAGYAARFRALLDDPGRVQLRVLREILEQNQDSAVGRDNGVAAMLDAGGKPAAGAPVPLRQDANRELYARFKHHFPVSSDALRAPLIERIAAGEPGVLTSAPVLAFEETGGSSGGRKRIPYTAPGLQAFQRGLLPWLDDLFGHYPALREGRFYWAISPACRTPASTSGGIPVGLGSDAAYFGEQAGMAVASALAVPAKVGTISDVASWRKQTLLHLLGCADLVMISVWSPTFLGELLRHAVAMRDELVAALAMQAAPDKAPLRPLHTRLPAQGTERESASQVKQSATASNEDSGTPSPASGAPAARAELVHAALASTPPDWRRIWPALQLISCWDQASSSTAAKLLRAAFPGVDIQGKGLLATEGMITLPLCGQPFPVLALESGFFEFIDQQGHIWLADEVRDGAEYEFLMTTHSGLYRYPLGDKVRVRGFAGRTPRLEFLGRGHCSSDLCGEKLTDAFVAPLLAALGQEFAMLAPDDQASPRYRLLLDAHACTAAGAHELACQLDLALCANPQYAYARQLGQLGPVLATRCGEPLQHWLAARMASGQRLGDIKVPALLTSCHWQSWAQPAVDAGMPAGPA